MPLLELLHACFRAGERASLRLRSSGNIAQAYLVTIRLGFESVADRDEFLEHFAESVDKVVSEEPGATVYRPSIDIADPTKIAISERCVTRQHVCWAMSKTDTLTALGATSQPRAARPHTRRPSGAWWTQRAARGQRRCAFTAARAGFAKARN